VPGAIFGQFFHCIPLLDEKVLRHVTARGMRDRRQDQRIRDVPREEEASPGIAAASL